MSGPPTPDAVAADAARSPSRRRLGPSAPWLPARGWWATGLLALIGLLLVLGLGLQAVVADFEADARIVHRLISQRAAQHDTMLATLNLLIGSAAHEAERADQAEQRLPALYPQLLSVQRHVTGQPWPSPAQAQAEQASLSRRAPVLAEVDLAHGRYSLLQAGPLVGHVLLIDIDRLMPGLADRPYAGQGQARYSLALGAGPGAGPSQGAWLPRRVLAPGQPLAWAWPVVVRKALASPSQPFELQAERWLGPADLPWLAAGVWLLLVAALTLALGLWRQQGLRRQRAEELLRLGQVARLDSLGELAAGMAHELNQPLTAVLASTQAALRVLDDDPPDLALSRQALQHAVAQAGRASEVLKRLRRLVERPGGRAQLQPVDLQQAVADTLQLLAPEAAARQVDMTQAALPAAPDPAPAPTTSPATAPIADTTGNAGNATPHVLADPVALQQVLHNLVMNALQALEQVPVRERRLQLRVGRTTATRALPAGAGLVEVADHGPGIAAHDLPCLFEPFYTTRPGGLGLGLSLCDTLVTAMGGRLTAANAAPRGALFTLALPLAGRDTTAPDTTAPDRAEPSLP